MNRIAHRVARKIQVAFNHRWLSAYYQKRKSTAYGWNWTFYDRVLRPVLDELRPGSPFYPALIAPDSKLPVKVQGAGMEYTVRESGDFIYIGIKTRG